MVIYSEIFSNIIAAIIVPSFLLTLISFIDTIIAKCKVNAEAIAKVYQENGELHAQKGGAMIADKAYQTEEELKMLKLELDISNHSYENAINYSELRDFLAKCQTILSNVNLATYTLLFLSMVLSPYIVQILSGVDLNSLTLWSLAVLYIDTELKPELCAKCFSFLAKRHLKKRRKEKTQ